MREDFVHVAVRRFLQASAWQLVAGQFPNGSDDQLPILNIKDPVLARDNSPAPRQHSLNKFVPDLVACRKEILLIIEMKPSYSVADENKLESLLTARWSDLQLALLDLVQVRNTAIPVPIVDLTIVPALGFSQGSSYRPRSDFCYFEVADLSKVKFVGNALLPDITGGG